MPPRIASLSEQAKALENRASELAAKAEDEQPERATAADLDALRGNLRAALNDSTPSRVKGVLQTMIDTIRVNARDQIEPTFRVPAVRIEGGYMALLGTYSNQELQGSLSRLAKKLAALRVSGEPRRQPTTCRQRPRRPGWVLKAVIQVLADRGEPMRVKDIHMAVETLVGESVAWSSVKMALARNVAGPAPRVVRIARGRYVLA